MDYMDLFDKVLNGIQEKYGIKPIFILLGLFGIGVFLFNLKKPEKKSIKISDIKDINLK